MSELIAFGGAATAGGDGKVSGRLVAFGGTGDKSPMMDIFDALTDFHLDPEDGRRTLVSVYWLHGQDEAVGMKRLGKAVVAPDEAGIAIAGKIDTSTALGKTTYEQAEAGLLAWSSGSIGHMVERRKVGAGRHRITSWPLAEASLAPRDACADPRCVVELKTAFAPQPADWNTVARAILAKPPIGVADSRMALEEAAHVTALFGLGHGVKGAAAWGNGGSVYGDLRPLAPASEKAAVSLAGLVARVKPPRYETTSWSELRQALSPGDWNLLTAAIDPYRCDSIEEVKAAEKEAEQVLASYSNSLFRVRDALLRQPNLSGAECEALFCCSLS